MAVEPLGTSAEDERGFEHVAGRLRAESKQLAARYPPGEFSLPDVMKLRSARLPRLRVAAAILFAAAGGILVWSVLKPPAEVKPAKQPPAEVLADSPTSEPVAEPATSPRLQIPDDAERAQAVLAWRFVITSPDEHGGRRVVATGLYIPERRKEVTFDELSPAEQYAVLRALGADEKPQWQL